MYAIRNKRDKRFVSNVLSESRPNGVRVPVMSRDKAKTFLSMSEALAFMVENRLHKNVYETVLVELRIVGEDKRGWLH